MLNCFSESEQVLIGSINLAVFTNTLNDSLLRLYAERVEASSKKGKTALRSANPES